MKLIKTGILTLMLSLLGAITAFSAQGSISFSDPEVKVGDEVNVSMKISADEGTALGNANVVLLYPSGNLEFISGTDADGGAGAIRVHGASNGKGTALLEYNLKFKTSSAGTFSVSIDSQEVYDTEDQLVEITHLGNSAISVKAEENASADCSLSSLDVYPGELDPGFSPDITTYSVKVGKNVTQLTINAVTADPSANVKISNNEALPEGDSSVIVTVNAADGTTSADYIINVSKVEGGPESTITSGSADLNDGVQLSSKGKTITIMNPSADVAIPEGFKQGTISIDDQKVQGWVWGASEDPEYCVVYGMNDKGEINFYRYDMVEKTIQRYFEDPLSADAVSNAEYAELEAAKAESDKLAETRLIIMVVIAVIAFAFLMACVYMWVRLQSSEKMQKLYRRQNAEKARRNEAADQRGQENAGDDNLENVNELLKHDYSNEGKEESGSDIADETQVIRRHDRKRRARRNHVSEGENPSVNELVDMDAENDDDVMIYHPAGSDAQGESADVNADRGQDGELI
ncbi:MAG: cadherin-like beta sandwich domain-containing protein [Lachnospiraceae bacterium]|nr:cadherin-like beta sandwich domain-containing protein [Lachnospiraceae bacterium]